MKLLHKIARFFYKKTKYDLFQSINELARNKDILVNTNLGKYVKLYSPYKISETKIGNYTYIAENSRISKTQIGNFCSIGPNFLCGWGIHPINGISTHPMFYSIMKQNGITLCENNKVEERKKITIGHDVFIGANVLVLDGVRIGNGAVIGAGAVVVNDIPDYAVAVGIPAKIVKYRFSNEIIKKLIETNWWNETNLDELKKIEENFYTIEDFLKNWKVHKS